MERWLSRNWVAAALCMAVLLALLMPVPAKPWPPAWLLTFAMLLVYMFHQVEEHSGDRFRIFVNRVFHGVEALTPRNVLWINVPGVWSTGLFSIYAATFLRVGWGLSSVYLVVVNAVALIVAAVLWREYNSGLWTAFLLFVPLGALA